MYEVSNTNINRRRLPWVGVVLALVLVLALALTGCGEEATTTTEGDSAQTSTTEGTETTEADAGAEEPSGEPLKIGMATTLSGPVALFGVANKQGAELAVEELNASGGVLGRPVEIIVRDDQARPEEGVAQVRDLIMSENIDALLGGVSSGVALGITEVAKERKIPYIVHTSNTEALTVEKWHPYMASVVPNTGMEARAQAMDLATREYTRWATIAPNYEFGQAQTGSFVETITAENPNVEIVDQQWPELGESDLDPFITALLAAEPEAVYSPLYGTDLVTFTRQAADLGFFERVYFTAMYETDALQELGSEVDLEGMRGYSRSPFTIDTPQMKDFVERFSAKYDEVPSDWACMAYDAVYLWAQVAETAGTVDADAFAETIPGFEWTSLRGDTYIREIDHQAAVGSYFSDLTFDEDLGFYVYKTAEPVPAEDIWLSVEEVKARRAAAQ